MISILERAVTAWGRRHWRADPAACAAFAELTPFVLITGASAGIGRALADCFAAQGWALFLVARHAPALAATRVELMQRYGTRVEIAAIDLTDTSSGDTIEAAVAAAGGMVDILVNNAGIGLCGPYHSHDHTDIIRLTDLNIRVPSELMRRFLPGMLVRGSGGVLTIGSLGGLVPGPHQAAYYASKAYLQSLTEAVAEEVAGQGVRICIIDPGPVTTAFHSRMGAEHSWYLSLIPVMKPEQVARAAVFWFRLGRTTIVPGALHHVSIVVLRLIPHSFVVPILGRALRKRTPESDV